MSARAADPLDNVPLQRFTLRFADPTVEKTFSEAQAQQSLRAVRNGLAAAAVLMIVFWFVHEAVIPANLRSIPRMTLVTSLVLLFEAGFFAATFTGHFERHHQGWMAALAIGFTLVLVAILPSDMLATRGTVIVVVHTFSIYTFMLRWPAALLCGLATLAIYVAAATAPGGFDSAALARSVFWLTVANIWGAVIGYHLDLRTRREFAAMRLLAQERERSENLLRNILPAPIAERLKTSRDAIADQVDEVTVLFADLVGFTALAERLPPERLVALLDRVFSEFDRLADRHGLEKIKTIGDAYMAVAGVPHPCGDHALRAARMAQGMLGAVRAVGAATGEPLALRVGIHSGPVVAGVIGTRKFSYDLWGDTVNTASRMESHAAPGTIQCTRATADRLQGMALRSRGEVSIKGKRALETFELAEAEEDQSTR